MGIRTSKLMKPLLGTPLHRGHRMSKGLQSCFLFTEGGGSTVYDSVRNDNPGTLVGDTNWVRGKHGWALDFDADGDRVNTTIVHDVRDWDGITIVAGVQWDVSGATNDENTIASNEHASSSDPSFSLYLEPDAGNAVESKVFASDGIYAQEYTDLTLVDDRWYQVAGTFDKAALRGFLDGRQGDSTLAAPGWDTSTIYTPFTFGSLPDGGEQFKGQIAYVMIWDYALPHSSIRSLASDPFQMFRPSWYEAILGCYSEVVSGNAGIMTTNTGWWGPTF